MRQEHSDLNHTNYDLLLLDEGVSKEYFTSNPSIYISAIEFVPDLDRIDMEQYFKSKKSLDQKMLYVSLDPLRLSLANQCSIDTCFLNNGNNDIMEFDKTYEIPYTKVLTLEHSTKNK